MSYTAKIQKNRVIEYGTNEYFNWRNIDLHDWLFDNDVDVLDGGENGEGREWELEKCQLEKIPDSAFAKAKEYGLNEEYLRMFVQECLDAPTGRYAFVSWW